MVYVMCMYALFYPWVPEDAREVALKQNKQCSRGWLLPSHNSSIFRWHATSDDWVRGKLHKSHVTGNTRLKHNHCSISNIWCYAHVFHATLVNDHVTHWGGVCNEVYTILLHWVILDIEGYLMESSCRSNLELEAPQCCNVCRTKTDCSVDTATLHTPNSHPCDPLLNYTAGINRKGWVTF